jgi:hypothetical protein
MPISRRDVLLGGAATAAALGTPGALAQSPAAPSVAEFLALSEKLTGAASLDPQVAKTLLDGFVATGHGAPLAELVRLGGATTPAAAQLENTIVGAWYSGLYATGKGQGVATFEGALVWSALTFTKPFGLCGGDTGYWAEPA